MKYKVNDKKGDEIKIDFEISAKEWEADVEHAYEHNRGKYKKEGFRPGKVPRAVLEGLYGDELFYEDAFNEAFPRYYSDMLKKEKQLYPVDYPEIGVDKMDKDGVKFSATITVVPEFDVTNYKGITVEKKKIEVKKAEVTKELENIRERHARFVEITDREVKKGDLVNLNYSGSVNGKKFDGGTAEDQELTIGSGSFIPDFEDQMIGMKIGEEKDLDVTFPEKYHSKELAGKKAKFAVKVLSIREKELPKLDDEFAKEVSEFESLNALSLSIEEKLAHQKEHEAEHEVEDKLVKTIVDAVDLKVPAKMIDKQVDYVIKDLEERLKMQGLPLQGYFEYLGITEEEFRKEQRKNAERNVKTSLVLEKIVEKEKIKVTSEDIDAKIADLAQMYSQKPEDLKNMLVSDEHAMSSISQEILTDKVLKFLKEKNKIA